MNDDVLRDMPVFEVGFRTALIKGCDFRILILIASLGFMLIFVYDFQPLVDVIVLPICLILFRGAQMMGKADEKMFDVWKRSLLYKRFYFAKAYAGSTCNKDYTRPWI